MIEKDYIVLVSLVITLLPAIGLGIAFERRQRLVMFMFFLMTCILGAFTLLCSMLVPLA